MSSHDSLELVPVEREPFNAEAPMAVLGETPTPGRLFFVRNHFAMPRIDPVAWRLRVAGTVSRAREWSLGELQSLPRRDVVVTMECAGNGRRALPSPVEGTPWNFGAVSTARFTGVSLSAVLDASEPASAACEVQCVGADRGAVSPGRVVAFERGLPLDVARRADTLLAWAMNDRPLAPEHGYPLRLVVPGWYGVASVKWLERLTLLPRPFIGFYQTERYIYNRETGTPDGTPVSTMRVRSVISRPANGATLALRPTEISGTAWSGGGPIERVEVSTDGGASWSAARLGPSAGAFAAVVWQFVWRPAAGGSYTLAARATDQAGRTQPLESVTNEFGYGNNVVHRVGVRVTE